MAAQTLAALAASALLAGCGGGAKRAPATRAVQPPSAAILPHPHVADQAARIATKAPPQRCTVDVYGDSIMASNGTPERPLAMLQKRHPALTFVDHAAPEALLTDLANRFDKLPRTGRWVVIQNGVIDAWRNVKPAVYVQTLQGMVERVRAEGREPVLTGFSRHLTAPAMHIKKSQLIRRDQYNDLTRLVAANMQVAFVDWDAVRFDGPDDLQDGINPGPDYSNRLFDKLLDTLVRVTDCR